MMRPKNPVGRESCRAMNRGYIVSRTYSLARRRNKAHIAAADVSFKLEYEGIVQSGAHRDIGFSQLMESSLAVGECQAIVGEM